MTAFIDMWVQAYVDAFGEAPPPVDAGPATPAGVVPGQAKAEKEEGWDPLRRWLRWECPCCRTLQTRLPACGECVAHDGVAECPVRRARQRSEPFPWECGYADAT